MDDLLSGAALTLAAISAAADKLHKTLEPDTGREEPVEIGEGDAVIQVQKADVLATAYLMAGSPTAKAWNAFPDIEARLEAAKPVLLAAHQAEAAAKEDPETPLAPPVATGVVNAILLQSDDILGPKGRVLPISRRKLADLERVEGEHWAVATAQQIATGLSAEPATNPPKAGA